MGHPMRSNSAKRNFLPGANFLAAGRTTNFPRPPSAGGILKSREPVGPLSGGGRSGKSGKMSAIAVKQFVSSSGVRLYRIPCQVFETLTARVYLLLGAGPPTLVDTGSRLEVSTRQILAGLEAVRAEFGEAVRPSDIGRILLTHGHTDHVGGLPALLLRTSAEVTIHSLDSKAIAARREYAVLGRRRLIDFLDRAGVEWAACAELLKSSPYAEEPGESECATAGLPAVPSCQESQHCLQASSGTRRPSSGSPFNSPFRSACWKTARSWTGCGSSTRRAIRRATSASSRATCSSRATISSRTRCPINGRRVRHSLYRPGPLLGIAAEDRGYRRPAARLGRTRASHSRRLPADRNRSRTHRRRLERLRRRSAARPGRCRSMKSRRKLYPELSGFRAVLSITDVGSRVEYLHQRGQLAVANLDEVQRQPKPVYRYAAVD